MSMAVKPGYINPLTMMGEKKNNRIKEPLSQKNADHDVQNLQMQRQSLQNQMLMLKSSSDGASLTKESQDAIEQQIEEISTELRTAKSEAVVDETAVSDTFTNMTKDLYKKQAEDPASPGLYQIQRNGEDGYEVLYKPFYEQNADKDDKPELI